MHPSVEDYLRYNLAPILHRFKLKSTICTKLPLSVVGRANLIKMIWAPQLLYILHNSPIWISLKWFKQIDALFCILLWKGKNPRIKLFTQLPKDGGGLAVPQPRIFFMIFQMQHFAGWGVMNWADHIQSLLLSPNPRYHLLAQLQSGAFVHLQYGPALKLMNKAW